MRSHNLPLEHFSLQLDYAKRAAELSNISLESSLLNYTQFWRRVGNSGWSFDTSTPNWQRFIQRVNDGESIDLAAHNLYLKNNKPDPHKHYFGCFRYDFESEYDGDTNIVRVHFRNNDSSTNGPLSISRRS